MQDLKMKQLAYEEKTLIKVPQFYDKSQWSVLKNSMPPNGTRDVPEKVHLNC